MLEKKRGPGGRAFLLPAARFCQEPFRQGRRFFVTRANTLSTRGDLNMTKTLDDLFLDTLKDIYFAERQIVKALPKMARAAQSDDLKEAFKNHREETEGQIERLQQVFELLGKPARGKTCEAIQGIIEEGEEIIEDFKDTPALDAGLISAAQAVEHYEMARYGTLIAWAKQLDKKDVVKLLEETFEQESTADLELSKLAEKSLNAHAKAA
tara:strand:- start:175 stop:804 length:630 start_codon:yes stop_codon:yes gene_type:complete